MQSKGLATANELKADDACDNHLDTHGLTPGEAQKQLAQQHAATEAIATAAAKTLQAAGTVLASAKQA